MPADSAFSIRVRPSDEGKRLDVVLASLLTDCTRTFVAGLIAAGFTITGIFLGRQIGSVWGKRVEILGGLILLTIGIKIIVEHLIT